MATILRRPGVALLIALGLAALAAPAVAVSSESAVAVSSTPAVAASSPPPVTAVVLPRDHGAHPGYQVEWWYTAGTVTDPSGRPYFWFATLWAGGPGVVARVNVVDLRADRIVLAREYVALTHPATGQHSISAGAFRVSFLPGGRLGHWTIAAPASGGALDLTLSPTGPYVLHGRHGVIEQGPGGPSAYYSAPRLRAAGALTVGGRRLAVHGLGWLDHQWGNFATAPGALRWNWFACQLRDGRDLMLYEFLDASGRPTRYRAATFVGRTGRVSHPARFTVSARGPFVRPVGAPATYSLGWRLEVPAAGLQLTIRARARHQYIHNRFVPSFWEGAAQDVAGPPGSCIVESSRSGTTTPL